MDTHAELEQRVTPLELFFDLVFVFAITQVTTFMAEDPTWAGLGRGMLVLAAVWWAWTAYAWLTNSLDPEDESIRLAMLAAMAAMLIVSLAVPGAFGEDAVLFGASYFVVRALHIGLYALGGRGDPDLLGAVLRMAPTAIAGPAVIVAAGFTEGTIQAALWIGALAADYLGVLVGRAQGWRVSPRHFAERHGLIIIIAIGESIVAIGVGAAGIPLGPGVVTAEVLGIVLAAGLWWAYFDVVAIVAEQKLTEAQGAARAALARDSYSYLHLPMVAGIVLIALAGKKALGDVGGELEAVPAFGLCGGLALYLLAHVAFRLRNVRTLAKRRLLVAVLLLALWPVATEMPALVALALTSTILAALITYEAIRFRDARLRVRARAARPA